MTIMRARFVLQVWLFISCLFALTNLPGWAQERQLTAPGVMQLRLVLADAALMPIRLASVRLDAEVHNGEALTRVELLFFNPNSRVLEGELQFPLLAGQHIVGMAMDMGGHLREAVPVEKARGQEIFEEVTRQRIDPALLEVTQGNNFKLRVYPLPPNGSKRVVLRISENLPVRDKKLVFRLPLAYAEKLPQLDLSLKVFGAETKPQAVGGPLGALVFAQRGEVYEASLSRKQFAARGVLEVRVPTPVRAAVSTQEFDGQVYFRAEIPAPVAKGAPRPLPRRLALYWDVSGSGAQREHGREFALLDRYFKAAGNSKVTLVPFSNTPDKPEEFAITNGNWTALKARLQGLAYDGATSFTGLPKIADAEEALLFSDGLENFNVAGMPKLGLPIYAISSSTSANSNALRAIAERSGGRLIDLQRLTDSEAGERLLGQAAELFLTDGRKMFQAGTDEPGSGVSRILLESRWADDGRFLIAGVVAASGGTLRARLRLPGGKGEEYALAIMPTRNRGGLAALTWARLKLAELDGDYGLKRGEIRRLGQLFRLPTRETSLIILDAAADYARYDVEPPPELAAQVEQLRTQSRNQLTLDQGRHLENVLRQFQEKQAWWNKEFPKGEKPKPAQVVGGNNATSRDGPLAGMAMSPSRPLPAPLPEERSAADASPPSPSIFKKAKRPGGGYKSDSSGEAGEATASITLKKWTSDAPYIRRFQAASAESLYAVYLDERPGWANSSAFYLDAADALFDKGQNALAIRVLSNLAEMNLENRALLRILAYRLMQAKQAALAVKVFENVRDLAPHEPQSLRDLGLAYAAAGQPQKAVDALWEVVSKTWKRRVPDIEMIALAEMNAIIASAAEKLDVSRIDPRLVRNLPLDLRVVLAWDTDNSDMDLWVTDPNGEKSYYSYKLSYQGGRMSADVTGGYGPEEYSLKKAKPGKYLVQANFYGHRQQVISAATTLQLKLQTGFGKGSQKEEIITVRLKGQSEVVTVGEFEVRAAD